MHPQQAIHASSLTTAPDGGEGFWMAAARKIDWIKPPSRAYGTAAGDSSPSWFPDGVLNTCYNALDRHCTTDEGRNKRCLIHVSPMPQAAAQPELVLSYGQVLERVQILAGVLKHRLGVKKGDRVVIYSSAVLEAPCAMLACARLGAIHSVVFGGFAPRELAKRIDDAEPVAVLATSCGIEPKGVLDYKPLLDEAFQHAKKPPRSLLLLRRTAIKGHTSPAVNAKAAVAEFDWQAECDRLPHDKRVIDCEPVKSSDPLYTLYTSGTTASPKGVVRTNGGNAVQLRYAMENTMGCTPASTFFCASDVGWVVGHVFIVLAPLLLGCASVLFEGKPILPDAGIFWRIVERYKVDGLFTAPTALRAVRKEDPDAKLMRKYNLRSLRNLFLAGERSEPGIISCYLSLLSELGAPGASVRDNAWSTESGSPITSTALSSAYAPVPPRPGSAGLPLPGWDVRVVDDDGKMVPLGQLGNIVLAPPLAPSALTTLWRNEPRHQEAYYDQFRGKGDYFATGDAGIIDEQGYVHILSRTDDVINCAGHRLSTSLIEQVVSSHPLIAECCVVGRPDELKGHVPFAYVTPAASQEAQNADVATLLREINVHVRRDIGGIATVSGLVKGRLPKTRSGKTLRRTIRKMIENPGDKAEYPPTIEDVAVVHEAHDAIKAYLRSQREAKL